MKKTNLIERFQQLAGIKPIYVINQLNEEDVNIEKSMKKDVSGFRGDLSKAMNEPKVKAVLDAGLADGSRDDDKLPYTKTKIPVKNLIPTQNEIGFDESIKGVLTDEYGSLDGILKGTPDMGGPIVTYAGKYIIDGHHRWSAVFAANPKAKMDALDIKKKSGFEPTDVLKAVHTAIAVELDKVPSSTAKGHNILSKPKSYDEVLAVVNSPTLTEKAAEIWAKYGYKTKEQIAKRLTNNLKLIADKGAISGAPKRTDMPQTNANKSDSEDKLKALAKGEINIAPPFEKVDKKLKENKIKKSQLRQIIKEEIEKANHGINLQIDDDMIDIVASSGEYVGFIEDDGKIYFEVSYEHEDMDEMPEFDGMYDAEFTDENWRGVLDSDHAFVKIIEKIGGEVEALGDYVGIKVDANKLIQAFS